MYPTVALLSAAFTSSGATPAASQDEAGFDYRSAVTNGVVAIDGRRLADDSAFTLRVDANGLVTGKVAGTRVRFWVSAAAARRLSGRIEGEARLAA
jgi:hypothetical protein